MIYFIAGIHKSGTTLVAKALHSTGISMGLVEEGPYETCKYEDPEGKILVRQLLSITVRNSLSVPYRVEDLTQHEKNLVHAYVQYRERLSDGRDWGFKMPELSLLYPLIKDLLPEHILIQTVRSSLGIIKHYQKYEKFRKVSPGLIIAVIDAYEESLSNVKREKLYFEDMILNGLHDLNAITGRKIHDVRIRKN